MLFYLFTGGLAKLYKFVTGSNSFTPLGLERVITVHFIHYCAHGCKCRPTASTCDPSISLPVHITKRWQPLRKWCPLHWKKPWALVWCKLTMPRYLLAPVLYKVIFCIQKDVKSIDCKGNTTHSTVFYCSVYKKTMVTFISFLHLFKMLFWFQFSW